MPVVLTSIGVCDGVVVLTEGTIGDVEAAGEVRGVVLGDRVVIVSVRDDAGFDVRSQPALGNIVVPRAVTVCVVVAACCVVMVCHGNVVGGRVVVPGV